MRFQYQYYRDLFLNFQNFCTVFQGILRVYSFLFKILPSASQFSLVWCFSIVKYCLKERGFRKTYQLFAFPVDTCYRADLHLFIYLQMSFYNSAYMKAVQTASYLGSMVGYTTPSTIQTSELNNKPQGWGSYLGGSVS